MATYVALLRGVNVGGATVLPMAQFRAALADLGGTDVASYIQSGNAVFRFDGDASGLTEAISGAVTMAGGAHPPCLVLRGDAFLAALSANPFADAEPKALHLFFLKDPVAADPELVEKYRAESEAWAQMGQVFYLHAPDGIGRSKLAAAVPRLFKATEVTARNLASCRAIAVMIAQRG